MQETLRVLVVEDNSGDADLILEMCNGVEGSQLQLECVDLLAAAQRRLARGGIDVVLLDLSLPDSQGLNTLTGICSETQKVPIVILTGLNDEGMAIQAAQHGAQDYLVKGQFASNLLLRSIRYSIERKRTEIALRESEGKFKRFIEEMNDGYCVVQRSRIVFVNSRGAQMFGYTPGEVVGKTIDELLPLDLVRELGRVYATSEVGGVVPPQYQITLKKKDGTPIPVELGATITEYAGRSAVSLVLRDLTDRKLMQKALERREQDYLILLESTHEGIIVIDVETLKVVFGNVRASKMFGFDPVLQDGIGVNLLDFVHAEDKEVILKGLAEDLYTSDRRRRYEVRAKTKDGKEMWVSALATRIQFQGRLALLLSLKDITQTKRAEEALEESREHYGALVENLSDAVFNFKDGVVVWCNDRVKEIYGYSKDELIGKDASFFIPENRDPLEFIKSIYSVIKKKGYFRGSARAKTKGGGTVDIEYSISQIPNKRQIELVTVARDITERRRLEEQLQLAGRLAAVGELAAGVAHELNNPLTAIQGFAQLLTARDDLDETLRSPLETIYKEAQRASKITRNLLSFSRGHEPERGLVSINEALTATLDMCAYQMKGNNIEVLVELAPNLPKTMADFPQMQEVFLNIMNNAEQAMVEAHGRGKFLVKTQKAGKVIQITFADDGPGISEENLTRIFDPFFTTKEVGKGTGLGLSICYGIVEAHGGHIYAKSKLGQGATFVVEMPIASDGH